MSTSTFNTEIEPFEVPMQGSGVTLPIVTPDSPFHPSRVHYVQEGFEVTEPIPAWTRDADDSKLFAAVPTSEAMAPLHPAGRYIIFRRNIHKDEPFHHIVYASVVWRVKPKPRRWWQFWRPSAEVLARNGWHYTVCVRHYTKDAKRRIALAALAPGFQTFNLGDHDGIEAKASILGIATSRRPTTHYISGVQA